MMSRVRFILAALLMLSLLGFVACKKEEAAPAAADKAAVEAAKPAEAAPAEAAPEAAAAKENTVTVTNFVALIDAAVAASKIEDCAAAVAALKAIPQESIDKAKAEIVAAGEAEPSEAEKADIEAKMLLLATKGASCPDFVTASSELFAALEPAE